MEWNGMEWNGMEWNEMDGSLVIPCPNGDYPGVPTPTESIRWVGS